MPSPGTPTISPPITKRLQLTVSARLRCADSFYGIRFVESFEDAKAYLKKNFDFQNFEFSESGEFMTGWFDTHPRRMHITVGPAEVME